jgi:hypothetical protein
MVVGFDHDRDKKKMSKNSQKKKNLHSLLAINLNNKLTVSIPSSSTTTVPEDDFDFSEVFGPITPHHQNPNPNLSSPPSTSSSFSTLPVDPPVIHNRPHSFVGPSPCFTLSRSLPPRGGLGLGFGEIRCPSVENKFTDNPSANRPLIGSGGRVG